jgi:hypothetical protein
VTSTPNVRQQNGERNKASEPEDHGKELSSQDTELMRCNWEVEWRKDEVRECKNGPHAAEEEEVG